ncbi:MAG: hypothetical protein M4579_003646 [Chaenotheca gracillima]|nr:MAG: hypothetical protein M4579_003646 [Chaenotheca gracillima]
MAPPQTSPQNTAPLPKAPTFPVDRRTESDPQRNRPIDPRTFNTKPLPVLSGSRFQLKKKSKGNTNSWTTRPPPRSTGFTEKSKGSAKKPSIWASAKSKFAAIQSLCCRLSQDGWLWELSAWTVSAVATIVIFVVLGIYDSHPLPRWPFSITMNALLSVLSTIAKATLLIPAMEALSQLKWIWFRHDRHNLSDIDKFDSASRGPWGSFLFLFSLGLRRLASLGALIIILSVAIDPVTQQVLAFPTQPSNSTIPYINYAESYVKAISLDSEPPQPAFSMKSAIYNGVYAGSTRLELGIPPSCATGNCTWPLFSSLAMCSECADITDTIQGCGEDKDGDCEATLPHGRNRIQPIDISSMNISITTNASQSAKYAKTNPAPVLTLTQMLNLGGKITASECILYYCIQTYNASVTNGDLTQKVVKTWHNTTGQHLDSTSIISVHNVSPVYQNSTLTPPADPDFNIRGDTTYTISGITVTAFSSYLATLFNGTVHRESLGSGIFSSDVIQALYTTPIADTMANLATSMTNNLFVDSGDPVVPRQAGASTSMETIVHVRWGWLALLPALVLLTLIFLLFAMLSTSRRHAPLWKSSPLALLFHGLEGEIPRESPKHETVSEMGLRAEKMVVNLAATPNGVKFALRI